MPDTVHIAAAQQADDALVRAFERIIPQLSDIAPVPTLEELTALVADSCTTLFLARRTSDDEILGALTLVVYRTPTGMRALIEDVVVDSAARGAGAGEKLVRTALDHAAQCGARVAELTSHASREAANRLYVRIGFELRETNAYRYRLR